MAGYKLKIVSRKIRVRDKLRIARCFQRKISELRDVNSELRDVFLEKNIIIAIDAFGEKIYKLRIASCNQECREKVMNLR